MSRLISGSRPITYFSAQTMHARPAAGGRTAKRGQKQDRRAHCEPSVSTERIMEARVYLLFALVRFALADGRLLETRTSDVADYPRHEPRSSNVADCRHHVPRSSRAETSNETVTPRDAGTAGTTDFLPSGSACNASCLAGYTYTLLNGPETNSSDDASDAQRDEVDCFGLGKTIAVGLEWFFMSKPNGSHALDVQFFLSSRRQPRRVRVVLGKQFGLEWTDFRIERRTIVIVHGFLSHGGEQWIADMEKAFLEWDDVNVIVVDWSAGGNTWNYYKAAVNTKTVGYEVASLLEHIMNATLDANETDVDSWGQLHFVGHSLGAHICGLAAKEFKRKQDKWIVKRITGLDPAQPCFKNSNSTVQLEKTDAQFVDVIHTNGKLLTSIGLGLPEPLGHADFYPNGGKRQPGCIKYDSSVFNYLPIPQTKIKQAICSHGRSYVYLTESLNSAVAGNCSFWAHHWDLSYRNAIQIISEPCNEHSCSEMGIKAESYPQRGTFFVATAGEAPFCVNSTEIIDEVKTYLEADHAHELED